MRVSARGLSVRRIDLVPNDLDYKKEYMHKIRTPAISIAEQIVTLHSELKKLETI